MRYCIVAFAKGEDENMGYLENLGLCDNIKAFHFESSETEFAFMEGLHEGIKWKNFVTVCSENVDVLMDDSYYEDGYKIPRMDNEDN